MKIDLTNHVAIVTGAAGQLGRAMARTLARCGASVAVHYRTSTERAKTLLAEVRAAAAEAARERDAAGATAPHGAAGATAPHGAAEAAAPQAPARAELFQADITDAASVKALQQAVTAQLGEPDILVLNAVSGVKWKTVLEQPPEDYIDQYRSCVLQAVHMSQAFAPAMIRRRWGRIIALNTECAMTCRPTESAYASAKRGLDGIVRVLAKELGPHQITVNQVAPGWTISDRDRTAGTEKQPEYEKTVALQRRGDDQDIANAVAFLASDLASFITGAYLPVCGGRVMTGI
jgi:3-oxoacyl-[acyl-carrier protein] reductase